MLFVCVNAGHYLIILNDTVVAEIDRVYANDKYYKWPKQIYRVKWRSVLRTLYEDKDFDTLADIHKEYHFRNYKGYNKVLAR